MYIPWWTDCPVKKRKDFELMTLMLLAGMPRAQPGERETLTKTDRSNVTPLMFYCRGKEDRERQRKRLLEERIATVYSSVMLIQTMCMFFIVTGMFV